MWGGIIIANRFQALLYGEPFFWLFFLLGSLGPAFGAYQVAKEKKPGVKPFLVQLFSKKIGQSAWRAFALFTLWHLIMVWFAFGIEDPRSLIFLLINFPLFIIGGGLEELGWRGYLQPQLERWVGSFFSILLVALLWGLWHLPLWLIEGTIQSMLPFSWYLLLATILSFSFTALYKNTGSVLLCVLSHAWFNGCIGPAVYVGANGTLQLALGWRAIVVFALELLGGVFFGLRKKPT